MDEVPAGLPIKIANVSNLSNIQVLNTFNQFSSTTPHNPFVVNNQYCFASCYEDGLQLYDISTPQNPVLAGYFDTYYQSGGNTGTWNNDYNGQWGCYPFFPSKVIFALDRYNGIFLLKTHLYQNPVNTVSVPELQTKESELKAFPNPSSGHLNIVLPDKSDSYSSLSVYDSRGAEVQKLNSEQIKSANSAITLSLKGIEPGIYFLKLNSENGPVYSGKFIFQP
ncbi:MAG: T9SS type A sorting domain-containing protein [Bacteroidia bacterium]|nr:T9SS type A sorting domain-containing protein [Bacteroidia bacterium]